MTSKKTKSVKGWKSFYYDLTARPEKGIVFQYEIGKRFTMANTPIPCERGFHFYPNFRDVYNHYGVEFDIRICEVKAGGDIVTLQEKAATNRITIVRELEPREIVEMMSRIPCDDSSRPKLDRDTFVEDLRRNLERYENVYERDYWILSDLRVSKAPEYTRKWLDERYTKWIHALKEFGL